MKENTEYLELFINIFIIHLVVLLVGHKEMVLDVKLARQGIIRKYQI